MQYFRIEQILAQLDFEPCYNRVGRIVRNFAACSHMACPSIKIVVFLKKKHSDKISRIANFESPDINLQ